MALKMARPMRRKGSTYHQLKSRIPRDVLNKARGVTLAIPVGERVTCIKVTPKAEFINISLRTRDPREAKERQSRALAYLDGYWHSLRIGPNSLTHKQIVALAGEVYHSLVGQFEDDPGSSGIWEEGVRAAARAMAGGLVVPQSGEDDAAHQLRSAEQWFGPTVDEVLSGHQLVIDQASRNRLLFEVGVAIAQAAERLRRNAQGDYRPDSAAERFPAFHKPKEVVPQQQTAEQTITGLVEDWWREAKAAGRSPKTYQSYESVARRFVAFLGHDDAHAVQAEDVIRFKDHRIANGLDLKTVKDSDMASLKAVFGWGVKNRRIKQNPAGEVRVLAPKKPQTREKGFTQEEAVAILGHALKHRQGGEQPGTFAAKRWVPWLCAYTGARVGEMAQLRNQDVHLVDSHWVITITPEAGPVKDCEFREVPLHPHLVEMGFAAFVQGAADGHLFVTPSAAGNIRGPLKGLTNRLREFAREVVTDARVAPNHGWRHRFKTVGREADISDRILDAFCGHAPDSVGARYGDVTLKAKAGAIAKFPRYEVK